MRSDAPYSSRLSTVLQTASVPLAQQLGVTDEKLLSDNEEKAAEITRLRLRVLELERAVDMDPLLDLYNRRAFLREIRRAQTVMERYDMLSSIIFFDLDGFKRVNDLYGHGVGDALLAQVARVLSDGVRDCDMVARLGGDEFGVLLFRSDPDVARAKANALACKISAAGLDHPDGAIRAMASWGVAPCEPGDTVEAVLDRADRAMYLDKKKPEGFLRA